MQAKLFVLTNFLTNEFLFESSMTVDVLELESFLFLGDAEAVLTPEIIVRLTGSEDHLIADPPVGRDPIPLALFAVNL